jgi:hypothetical protein
MLPPMRFYILPKLEDKTTYINFDHVASISVVGANIEIQLVGLETPVVIPKNVTTLNAVGKGMDLSDSSKEFLSNL